MTQLTPDLVRKLASQYEQQKYGNDETYFENLWRGRQGDVGALKRLTEWKNAGSDGRPMSFEKHKQKIKAWKYFRSGLPNYLAQGKERLRDDFRGRAPVWAIFWHHVLYGTPIFDVNTHVDFSFFGCGKRLTRKAARISAGDHWELYDKYCRWFERQLTRLKASDPDIDERMLDRALFIYGRQADSN